MGNLVEREFAYLPGWALDYLVGQLVGGPYVFISSHQFWPRGCGAQGETGTLWRDPAANRPAHHKVKPDKDFLETAIYVGVHNSLLAAFIGSPESNYFPLPPPQKHPKTGQASQHNHNIDRSEWTRLKGPSGPKPTISGLTKKAKTRRARGNIFLWTGHAV